MNFAGRNGSVHYGDATMPRDNPEGSSSRCLAAREVILPHYTLKGRGHRAKAPKP
jgi:hypothetical protein